MNRAFLIIVIPAIFVAAGYLLVIRYIGVELDVFRFLMAALGVVVAVGLVYLYRRRKARRPSS